MTALRAEAAGYPVSTRPPSAGRSGDDEDGAGGNRPHPTSLGLAASLVEGGATTRASLWQGLERRRLSVALMWFSPSVGATGRLVRPAYRTPFGVDKPTIQGRATAARTARHLWTHSTNWQYDMVQNSSYERSCRLPLRPTRVVLPSERRNPSLSPHGPQVRSDGQRDLRSRTTCGRRLRLENC